MTKLLFGAPLVVGAALLFWIELLAARLLLPLLGGSASVWNTSLVFFQLALLAGYLYAHASTHWLKGRLAPLAHPALLLAAALLLPVSVSALAPPRGGQDPLVWQLVALLRMVGPPFVVMAGTASLLQAWYARLGEADSRDPYFLYAASNFGSLAALVTYPTLIEPSLHLADQSRLWTFGYLALAALTALCAGAMIARGRQGPAAHPAGEDGPDGPPPLWTMRLRWLVLAFAPSSLLLGVTTHLTENVAAAPMFWVIPLTLYLLSFVLAFQTVVPLPERWTAGLQAALLAALAVTFLSSESGPSVWLFALNLAAFFATALLCHQQLARLRPPASHLTEFYLVVSIGGALGGVFNALIAPLIFVRVIEYTLILVVACLLRPGDLPSRKTLPSSVLDLAIPTLLLVFLLGLIRFADPDFTDLNGQAQVIMLLAGLLLFSLSGRPLRFALAVGALVVAGGIVADGANPQLAQARNFYGVLHVIDRKAPPIRVLINGTIEHGAQSLDPARRLQPLSYYHPAGPLGQLFAKVGGGPLTQDVAAVGLGAGSVACYAHPGERWTFFEINPAVLAIASNPRLFNFLRDCPAHPGIVLGDARLSIARAPDHAFGMIILDAFSSDAIPTHLMTRQAVQLYLSKLKPGGLIVFHISNQFLDLGPVVGGAASSLGLTARLFADASATSNDATSSTSGTDYQDASDWVVVARTPQDLAPIAADRRWRPLAASPSVGVWTDDYSNVFGAFLRRQQTSPSP